MRQRQEDEDLDRRAASLPFLHAPEQPVEQCERVMQRVTGGPADVLGEQQPGQGDVFVLGEVAQLVVNGDASARRPAARRREIASRDVHAGGDRRNGASGRRIVGVIELLRLVEELERAGEVAVDLRQASLGHTPAIGVLRQREVIAQFGARAGMAAGSFEVVAFEEQLAEAGVHVGSSPQRTVGADELETRLEGGDRGAQTTSGGLDVGEGASAAQDVGVVLGLLEAADGLGVAVFRGVELAE